MYDIIGDIHGQAAELEALLNQPGYSNLAGIYSHPESRQAVIAAVIVSSRGCLLK
jgi:hypothetical protein